MEPEILSLISGFPFLPSPLERSRMITKLCNGRLQLPHRSLFATTVATAALAYFLHGTSSDIHFPIRVEVDLVKCLH